MIIHNQLSAGDRYGRKVAEHGDPNGYLDYFFVQKLFRSEMDWTLGSTHMKAEINK